MYCTNCGRERNDRAAMCPHCGVFTEKSRLLPRDGGIPGDHRVSLLALISYCTAFLPDSVYYWLNFFRFGFPLGIVFSVIGLVQCYRSPAQYRGREIAIAGFVIYALILLIFLCVIVANCIITPMKPL